MTALPCYGLTLLFCGSSFETHERNKNARETKAKSICFQNCSERMWCLERAMVWQEYDGVWGGMTGAERRRFRRHLNTEGYHPGEVPEGIFLWASLNAFYRSEERQLLTRLA